MSTHPHPHLTWSEMSRNGDIRGFFTAAGPSSSRPQAAPASSSGLSSLPTSQPTPIPDLPSSPITPPKPAPRVLDRSDEIKGSDEDDDDSDDSLESISVLLGEKKSTPAAHRRDPDVLQTPQAKRFAYSSVHKSPLTLQPKKHRLDLKSLVSHSRQDEKIDQSADFADGVLGQSSEEEDANDSDREVDPSRIHENAKKLLADDDEDNAKGDRAMQAYKRTKPVGTKKCCYFFDRESSSFMARKNQFPKKAAKGHWKYLADPVARNQHFIRGLPHLWVTMAGRALPDEIFLWVLDEICQEKDALLRTKYASLIEICEDSTHRLVNDMRLYLMLERIGGPKYARDHSKFESSPELEEPRRGRDWSGLATFLQLLTRVAPNLQIANAISAVQLLLRMSLDPVILTTIHVEFSGAMEALVSVLVSSNSQWDTACEAICSYIYENVSSVILRSIPITLMPNHTAPLKDLQRRLAGEALFNDPGLGSKPLERYLTLERIRARLIEPDFRVTHQVNSRFFDDLLALVNLLDIVIANAQFLYQGLSPVTPSPTTRINALLPASSTTMNTAVLTPALTPQDTTKFKSSITSKKATQSTKINIYTSEDKAFDARVDTLVSDLRRIHGNIIDSSSDARKEVKTAVDALLKRLTYSVRTRRPPRKDIYEVAKKIENLEGQKDFMKGWTANLKGVEEEIPSENE
ncbi:hypothetical protein F5Y15DRAFT_398375 [Xylariaceae sp. FL0016]|nr:hypothetical protein F5Y15DRAFT_398375 [Xylariaceae sp. FL0016]